MSLLYDLNPVERGLEQSPERGLWSFPEDYIQRLESSLSKRFPAGAREPEQDSSPE